jgi:hypothetical protein
MAWQWTTPEVTVKGFKMYCVSNTVDETNDILWNGSVEVWNIRSECEEDEDTNC